MLAGGELGRVNVPVVIETSQIASGLNAAANAVEKQSKALATKFNSVGRSLSKGITIPVLAAGTAVLKFGVDFDKAMTNSMSIMGDVSKEMRSKLAKTAIEVSKTTTFAAKEAAEGYYFLISAGMNAEQSMAALPVVAKFAQAGLLNLAEATSYLADAQSALGLKSADATENMANMTRVADVLAKASILANGSIVEFSQALTNKAAGALRSMNKPMEEGVAALASFADQGRKGNLAGEALNIILSQLPKLASQYSAAFKDAGVAVFDQTGKMRNLADVIEVFEGKTSKMTDADKAAFYQKLNITEALADNIKMLSGTSGKMREYQRALEMAGGAVDEVSQKQLQSFNAKLTILKNRLVAIGLRIFDLAEPMLRGKLIPALDDAVERLDAMSESFAKLPEDKQIQIGLGIAGLAAAGPALIVIAKLITSVGVITATFLKLGVVVSKIGGLFSLLTPAAGGLAGVLSGPLLVAVAGIAAAALWVSANWEKVSGTMVDAGRAVQGFVSGELAKLTSWTEKNLPMLHVWWREFGLGVEIVVSELAAKIGVHFDRAWTVITFLGRTFWTNLATVFSAGAALVRTEIQLFLQVATGDWSGAWTTIKDAARGAGTFVVEHVAAMWDGIKATFADGIEWIKGKGAAIKDAITLPFAWAYDKLVGHSIVPDMVREISENLERMRVDTGALTDRTVNAWIESWKAGKIAILAEARDLAVKTAEEAAKGMPKEQRKEHMASARKTADETYSAGEKQVDASAESVTAYREIQLANDRVLQFQEQVMAVLQTMREYATATGQTFDQELFNSEFIAIWDGIGFSVSEAMAGATPSVRELGAEVERALGARAVEAAKRSTDAVKNYQKSQKDSTKETRKNIFEMKELSVGQQYVVAGADAIASIMSALPGKYQRWAQVAQTAARIVRIAMAATNPVMAAVQIGIELITQAFGMMGDEGEKALSNIDKMVSDLDDALTSFGDRFTDELVRLVRTGKAQWADFTDFVIEELLRITMQYAITEPIMAGIRAMFGGLFADGGAFLGGRVLAYANGGIVDSPTLFPMAKGMGLMGEAGPEAVLPLKRLANGKLGVMFDGGGGGGGNVNVDVHNYSGGEASYTETMGADGTRNIAVVIREATRRDLSYGHHDDALGDFGVRRRPRFRR